MNKNRVQWFVNHIIPFFIHNTSRSSLLFCTVDALVVHIGEHRWQKLNRASAQTSLLAHNEVLALVASAVQKAQVTRVSWGLIDLESRGERVRFRGGGIWNWNLSTCDNDVHVMAKREWGQSTTQLQHILCGHCVNDIQRKCSHCWQGYCYEIWKDWTIKDSVSLEGNNTNAAGCSWKQL